MIVFFNLDDIVFHNELIECNETKLLYLRQLTFSGKDAVTNFSRDEKHLIFQSHDGCSLCDQRYIMNIEMGAVEMISTGEGVTTCSCFLYSECKKAVYASTHLANKECPPKPEYSKGYVWKLYPGYDVFLKDLDGKPVIQLTDSPCYDAESTVAFDGSKTVYTSMVSGDLEIWTMDVDGSNKREVTDNGAANFGSYSFPDEKKTTFWPNLNDKKGITIDFYPVNVNGSDFDRVTFFDGFDGFPMFSPSGKDLVFVLNRNQRKSGGTNLFLAEWNYQ